MANRRISELQELAGLDLVDQDLLTVVHVFEVDPTLKNRKLTISGTKEYLNQYYLPRTGGTVSGALVVQGDLTVSGSTNFATATFTGAVTVGSLIAQSGVTASGTISGATITGSNIQGTNVNGVLGNFTTITGGTINIASGNFLAKISGVTITGASGAFTSLTGQTITGTTVNVQTITGVGATFTTVTGNTAGFTTVTGVTVTGTSGGFVTLTSTTGNFTSLTGVTTTGTTATFTSGSFTSLTGVTTTVTSGIFALGSAAAPSITISGAGIYSPGADQLAISTGGTGRIIVDGSGNVNIDSNTFYVDAVNNRVGIGTPSPSIQFQVLKDPGANNANNGAINLCRTATVGSTLYHTYSTAVSDEAFAFSVHGSTSFSDTTYTKYLASAGGVHVWYGATNATERARIDSSGRLLVGTSSARNNFYNTTNTAQFQLEGTNFQNASASLTCNANNTFDTSVLVFARSNGASIGSNTLVTNNTLLGAVSFMGNDGTEFVKGAEINAEVDGTPGANDMPGRLVFSTTADGAASPTERMRINKIGQISSYVLAGAGSFNLVLGHGSAASSTTFLIAGTYGATDVNTGTTSFLVATNGDVTNTNNSYGAISDAKLKENIVDATSQWADVKAFRVRKYNLKQGQTHTQLGVIANEIELISPGLVTESPDRDTEGNDLGTVTKSVNYSVLYMKAVKALQEAMERIETLEASNADMLARVTALEAA